MIALWFYCCINRNEIIWRIEFHLSDIKHWVIYFCSDSCCAFMPEESYNSFGVDPIYLCKNVKIQSQKNLEVTTLFDFKSDCLVHEHNNTYYKCTFRYLLHQNWWINNNTIIMWIEGRRTRQLKCSYCCPPDIIIICDTISY